MRSSFSFFCLGFLGLMACDSSKGLDECDEGTILDAETGDCIPDGDTDDTDDTDEEEEDTDLSSMWRDSFTGTVSVDSTIEGNSICATTVSLAGTKFTGECPNCDFAFDIEATIDSRVPEACDVSTYYTWYLDPEELDEGTEVALHMAHSDSYSGYYGSYDDAFLFGYTVSEDYRGYTSNYGPYFSPMTYSGSTYGSFSRTGDEIAWTLDEESEDVEYYYSDSECEVEADVSFAAGEAALGGDYVATGSLPCSSDSVDAVLDVYTLTLAEAGDVTITVDTVADGTAFDPFFWINDTAGCVVDGADDSFDCTFPPPEYQCPSGTLTAVAGTFQVVVGNYGSCNGAVGDYSLTVGATTDPTLTLLEDDAPAYAVTVVSHAVSGSGTLSAE